jgi:hypothetical protein
MRNCECLRGETLVRNPGPVPKGNVSPPDILQD